MSDKKRSTGRPDTLRRALTLSALGLAGAALTGCGGGSEDEEDLPNLRFVNGTLEYTSMSVYLDGSSQAVLTGLNNGGEISAIRTVDEGVHTVRMASTSPAGEVSGTKDFELETYTTALVYGPTTAKLLFIDENSSEPASGSTRLRVFQAASTAGALDVYVTATNVTDLTALTPDVEGLAYDSNASMNAPVTLDSGTYRIHLTAADSKTPLYRSANVTFPSRSVVALVVIPDDGDLAIVALPERRNGNLLTDQL